MRSSDWGQNLTKISNRKQIARNYSPKKVRRSKNYQQPFWLPASSFYILATAIAAVFFFLMWGVLHNEDEMPWIPAGVIASLILIGAVILREVVLRNRRNQLIWAQERLDFNLKNIYPQTQQVQDENKLTLEKNATILRQIIQKSEAANVLGKFSEVHWEVFELCDEYLHRSKEELQKIGIGSPRLGAIKQGRSKVQALHKLHLLNWSSAESRELIQEAKSSATISKKLELATKAVNILDSAVQFYPDEPKLIESLNAVREFVTTVKISHWIEQAERFAFKGNYNRAISSYRDALFYLGRENIRDAERDLIAAKINQEIEKLRKNTSEKKSRNLQAGTLNKIKSE